MQQRLPADPRRIRNHARAFNMMVPPKVRLGLSGRPLNVDDMLRSLRLPVLVLKHRAGEGMISNRAQQRGRTLPCRSTRVCCFQSLGDGIDRRSPLGYYNYAASYHAAADLIAAELAAFVRSAQKGN